MKWLSLPLVVIFMLGLMASAIHADEVTIGAGDQTAQIPMDFYWKNSLFETIYYPGELGFASGTIRALKFYNNFVTANPNGATKIWLGVTTQADLSTGWIPSTQLSLVFDGMVTYPSGANTINIQLTTPFNYTGGNLVMMVNRPMDTVYYSSSDHFQAQTIGSNRSRKAMNDSILIDPANPPATSTLSGQFPKTTFFYTGQALVNDIGCFSVAGNLYPIVGDSSPYVINVTNNGSAVQNTYTVKLMKEGNVEVASVAGTTINPQQTLQFTINWTPSATGATYVYGQVVMTGDEIPQNNQTGNLNVVVQAAGSVIITIGTGGSNGRMPVDMYYKNSLFETVYLASELNIGGLLTGIQFYNYFSTNLPNKPTRIWVGETTQTDLAAGWIPSSQLSQVFNGNVNYPSGANNIRIELNTPYHYGGGNLVVMIQRPMDTYKYSPSDMFLTQTGSLAARTRNVYSDTSSYNPASPPTTTPSAIFPKTSLIFSMVDHLQIISPNGGENWQAGSTKTVYWSTDFTRDVNIYLSSNGGESWIMLNANPVDASLGRYSFTVPFVSSGQCLVKVENTSNNALFDVSDSHFSISTTPPASLFLTAPTNAKLQAGRSYNINWLANGVTSVNLEYSIDAGMSWQGIAAGLPSTQGVYNWVVPDLSASGCYLRVSDSANPSVYDWSDEPFSICKLIVLSPNGGEFFQTGWSRNITWQSELVTNLKLEYSSNGGVTWQTIIASTAAASSSYTWTLPGTVSSQYLVRISDVSDGSINDTSAGSFTVCDLALTYPSSSGIKLQTGRDYNITWSSQLLPGSLTLELTTNGTNYMTIATGIDAALQSYTWTVPDTPSLSCKIRIVSEQDNQVISNSANNFTICRLRVTVPNGSEIWGAQSTKAISWSATNVTNLKLEYSSNDGATWQTINASVTASSGSYNWTLPNIHSTQCRVRITDTSNSAIWDSSDNSFTIRPQIILSAPNGSDILTVGSVYSILWSSTAEVSFVLIDYSIDGGTSWLPVQSSNYPASVGRYDWIVPNNPSANCLVRVRKHDNSAIIDVSDAAFTIIATPVPPVAQFSADITSGLEPLSVQFGDESTPGTGSITSWLWDFGNGDSSILQHPLYVYNTPGSYSVTLTVTNGAGLSNSLTLEDYITVLPRYPEIITNPELRLDFGNVYLGSASQPLPLWIRNTGTATLHVDALSYLLASSPFAVQERTLPFSIPEGDSLCIHLVFTPQVAGTVTDSLYIHSNAQNRPVYALGLRGSGEYVPPKPPTGVETAMLGYDMHISWDAVTETIFDTPITPDGYLVFYNGSDDPEDEFYFHGFTPGLSYTHYNVGRYAQHMFYRVMAVKHYGLRGFDMDSLVRGMPEKEVLELLQVR